MIGRFVQPGTKAWLIRTEHIYGGFVVAVPRRTVSRHDPRPPEELRRERLKRGGMKGGDRMGRANHNYGTVYARELQPFVGQPVTLIEVGVLRGTGLATWCDLFPAGHIVGLDIDLTNFETHRDSLAARGAFTHNAPFVEQFDAYEPDQDALGRLLYGRTIDILIDDGPHFVEAIVATARAVRPHLADSFVYIVEDNPAAAPELAQVFSTDSVDVADGLIVIKPRR